MHRVDVGGEPDARVAHLDLRRLQPGAQVPERSLALLGTCVAGRSGRSPAMRRAKPRADQRVVVVPRDDDHLGARGQRRAERAQHRLGGGERLVGAALEQLERVAEQHQPVDAGDRRASASSAGGRRSTSRPRSEPRCRSEMTSVRSGGFVSMPCRGTPCVTIRHGVAPGKLLIASPAIVDPHFRQTVVLLAEHRTRARWASC